MYIMVLQLQLVQFPLSWCTADKQYIDVIHSSTKWPLLAAPTKWPPLMDGCLRNYQKGSHSSRQIWTDFNYTLLWDNVDYSEVV